MGTLTMKFGGMAVGTTVTLTQVSNIISQESKRWDNLIIIVSALEGVTDALLEASHLAQLSNRRGYRRIVANIRTRHLALIEQLPFDNDERNTLLAEIDRLLFEMLDVCQSISDGSSDSIELAKVDMVIGVGEQMTARIIAALMRQSGLRGVAVDATDLIITDKTFGNAKPNQELTKTRIRENLAPMIASRIIPVITGFIGGTPNGQPTTLGRGGSDYTASLISVHLNADELWLWTSVDGMMTTDPRKVQSAQIIPQLSYREVAELSYFGAKILHTRMIAPLQQHTIPLYIKNIFNPKEKGTKIHQVKDTPAGAIKAVTSIQGIGFKADQNGPLYETMEQINKAFIKIIGDPVEVTITAQSSAHSFLCAVIPTSAGHDAHQLLIRDLESRFQEHTTLPSWEIFPVYVITTVGMGLDASPEVTASILNSIKDIQVLAISQGPSRCSISVVVTQQDRAEVTNRIHDLIMQLNSSPNSQ